MLRRRVSLLGAQARYRSDSAYPVVSIVYGSFEKGFSSRDAKVIRSRAPNGINISGPKRGTELDFNSLKDTTHLIICTSSQNGFPPENFADFTHQLLLAAETGDEGCLSHMKHAVFGVRA